MRSRARFHREGGFALALVVLMLFAIGVAATAAYQVVRTEFMLSTVNRQSILALSVARAGLQRFIAEQIGTVGDSVSYAIGDGVATVTSRRLLETDSTTYLYYLRSEGVYTDPRAPQTPARRAVGTYAWYHTRPVKHKAAVMVAAGNVGFRYDSTEVDGLDHATSYDCAGGGTAGVAGAIASTTPITEYGATITGNPSVDYYSSNQAVVDSAGIRWDILSDPNFPVEFDGSPPDFSALPADSFPVVRYVGNLSATSAWSGRGVLIVTGYLSLSWGFSWQGIILAGALANVGYYTDPQVEGTLIAGLNQSDNYVRLNSGNYDYNSCYVYAANESLSYLDVVDKTIFEINR